MNMSKAIDGYLLDKRAEGYSQETLRLYSIYLPILCDFLGDKEISHIQPNDLKQFLIYLQDEYVPKRFGDSDNGKPLSGSAIANHWKAMRSFFGWASTIFDCNNPAKEVKMPEYQEPPKIPFTEHEIKKLIEGCEFTTTKTRDGFRSYKSKRPTAARDKAIIMFLLDTGIRIGELCRIRIEDIDMEKGEILITPFGTGQKSTSRYVYIGKRTRRVLWIHLAKLDDPVPTDRLFDLDSKSIRSMLRRLGEKAGVKNVNPHRFRHTFAISFLRNGGSVFSLQRLLGHSSLDMVERYLNLAKSDIEEAHRKASPADNWRL